MNVQLITKVNGNQEYIELYGNELLSLDLSFAEIQDITKKNSAFTKEFDVPGTNQNNYIFNYFFDFNQVPLDWTPSKKFGAYLTYNGYIIQSGYIRLNYVTINKEEKTYNITFYNGVGDVAANIGDKFMNQLNLSYLSHPMGSDVYLQSQLDYNLFPLTGTTNYSYQNGKTFWGLYNIGYNYLTNYSALTQYYFSVTFDSITIDGGNKTVTFTSPAPFKAGDRIRLTYNANNWIEGVVLSNNLTTGVLTFDPDLGLGSGTYSQWTSSLIIPAGSAVTDPNSTPLLEFNGATPNYFSFSGTPVRNYYFKPSIQIKELYEQIFLQAGYEIDSNFFNTSYFERYYLPLKFLDETVYTKGSQQPCFSFSGSCVGSPCPETTYIDPYYYANTLTAATCNNIPFSATSTGFTIDASFAGNYIFQIVTNYNLESDGFNGANFGGALVVNGNTQFFLNATQGPLDGINNYTDTSLVPLSITGNTTISLAYDPNFNSYLNSFSFSIYFAPRVIIGNFDYASEFPDNDFKQIDFITSINKLFNLVVVQHPTKQNTLIVEPIIDYIGKGEILDWTDKIDWDSSITVQPTTNYLNGTLNFNFKLDKDQVNQQFNISANRIFGTYEFQLSQEFKDNIINFDTIFGSPTDVAVNNNNLPSMTLSSMAALKTEEVGGLAIQKFNPYKIIPRVIFRGPVMPNDNWSVPSTADTQTWWAESYEIDRWQSTNRFNTYPFSYTGFSHYINFNASNTYNSTEDVFPSQQDMYDIYYYDYISDIVSPENKLIKAKIYLTPYEVANLRFDEKIIVKNNYYRINKISNYNLTEPSLCEVELIKLTKSYTPHPVKYFKLENCGAGPDLYTTSDLNYNIYAYVGKYVNVFTGSTTAYTSTGCYQVVETEPIYNVDYEQVYIGSGYTSSGVNVYSDCGCSGRTAFDIVQQEYPEPTTPPIVTPSLTPTSTTTPTMTPTSTATPTMTPTTTPTPSVTPTITSSPTPSVTPTLTLTQTATNTSTPTPSVTPTITPSTSSQPVVPFDSDAAAYLADVLAAGGTLNSTLSAATNTLFTSLKSANLYNKMFAFYPLLGATAASTAIMGKRTSGTTYDVQWYGGWSYSISGATGNGSNTYAQFNISGGTVPNTNSHFTVYGGLGGNTQSYDLSINEGNAAGKVGSIILNFVGTGNGYYEYTGYQAVSGGNSTDFVIVSRNAAGTATIRARNGVALADKTEACNDIGNNRQWMLGCEQSSGGGKSTSSTNRYSWVGFGQKLTAAELLTYQSIINTFQTSVGRNTY